MSVLVGLGVWALIIIVAPRLGFRFSSALKREGLRQKECVTRFLAERDSQETRL